MTLQFWGVSEMDKRQGKMHHLILNVSMTMVEDADFMMTSKKNTISSLEEVEDLQAIGTTR